jgi:hypothetical protein
MLRGCCTDFDDVDHEGNDTRCIDENAPGNAANDEFIL